MPSEMSVKCYEKLEPKEFNRLFQCKRENKICPLQNDKSYTHRNAFKTQAFNFF